MNQSNEQLNRSQASVPVVETRDGVVLAIYSGLLAGSERFIDKRTFLIGSSTEADIILLDDEIAPVHLAVSVARSLLGTSISVQALGEEVIFGGKPLPFEEFASAPGKVSLSIAGIEFSIQDAKGFRYNSGDAAEDLKPDGTDLKSDSEHPDLETHLQRLQKRPMMFAAGAAACISVGILLMATGGSRQEQQIVTSVPNAGAEQKGGEQFMSELRTKLKEFGLDNQVNVSTRQDKSFEVTGNLRTGYGEKWLAVLQWYDAQQNPPFLYNMVAENPDESNLPEIKFVWFGKDPYIVLQNRQKVTVGDTIKEGWKVDSIDSKGVLVSLASRRVLIKFE